MDSSFWIKCRYFVWEEFLFVDAKNCRQTRELYDVKYDKEWGGNQLKENVWDTVRAQLLKSLDKTF